MPLILSGNGNIQTVSGTNAIVIDNSSRVTIPNQTMFSARGRGSNMTAVSEYTPVNFTDIRVNTGSWNNSTGTFTAPIAGRYMVLWTCGNKGSENNGAYVGLYVLLNNNSMFSGWALNTGYDSTAHCGGILQLAAGDTIKYTYHNGYGNPSANATFTQAVCYLVG